MLLLSREDIKKVITMKEVIECDKQAFRMAAEGRCDMPLRQKIDVPSHDAALLFMPTYAEEMDSASIKIINQFPHNIEKGLISSPAQVILIDGVTGYISAVLDGNYITQLRTGASSGAAFDLLAKKDCRKGALIGTGGQAPTQLEAMLTVRKLEEVAVYDIDPDRTAAFAEKMNAELRHLGARIRAVASSDEAITDADLIITVTPSTKPVFDAKKVKNGATVSCVGAYQYHMQELDPALLPRASKVFCDLRSAVLSESGDILQPLDQGIITEADLSGDLGDLVAGHITGRENDDEIIIYETVGIGAQDLVTARKIYDRAVEMGIGTKWG